ncbi:MAG: tRNA-dihydrouridine synthase [Patescibacteria group bacterium]|nr:tRNA-dihydrouridine synthase [Patescibacteria group bacterium]
MDFWHKLKKPIFVLAPMANVTDAAFRRMIAKHGKPDAIWTEFVSADGLISPGRKNLLHDLEFTEKERPIVAQLFTGHPEAMKKAARLAAKLGFDGIDINMGCPDRAVEKQGGGAALAKQENRQAAVAVIEAAREGVRSKEEGVGRREVPVSVKTRLGYNKIDMDWIKLLLEQDLPVLTIHMRTRREMSDVPAHWELMPEIIRLRDEIAPDTLIFGNGDVASMEQASELCARYGCDGVMIGRGIFGKPWFFDRRAGEKAPEERLKIMVEHAKLFDKLFCGRKRLKSFDVMKKHFKAYVSGWDGAKELRMKLMEADDSRDVADIVKDYLRL